MRPFVLVKIGDESHPDTDTAEGVQFTSGRVVISGLIGAPTITFYDDIEMVEEVLDGMMIVWTDGQEPRQAPWNKFNFEPLVRWRDSRALDWYGEELVSHVRHALEHEPIERIPEEYKEAIRAFRGLDEEAQYRVVEHYLGD